MARYTVHITARPPGPIQRAWYRRLGLPLPLSVGSTGPWHADLVRLLPYRRRALHQAYARIFGFAWLPCVLCDRAFGGHEAGGSVPDPVEGPGISILICSRCTRDGRGQDSAP